MHLDDDLLSLEIPNICKKLYFDIDMSNVVLIAESIRKLEFIYGKIIPIFAKGHIAQVIMIYISNIEKKQDKAGFILFDQLLMILLY